VDRLGRSLQDLVGFLTEVHALGINLFLHQQGIDTTTPAGKALFQMISVFAEFERAMIRERVKSGLERARAQGKKTHRRPEGSCDKGRSTGGLGRHHEARSGAWGRRGDGPADQPRTGAQPRLANTVPAGCPPTEGDPKRLWRLSGGFEGSGYLPSGYPSGGRPRSPGSLGEASQNERVGNILRLAMFAHRLAVIASSAPVSARCP
jgi:Resolvase, N terminal domain